MTLILLLQGLFIAAIGSIGMMIGLALMPHNKENIKKRLGNVRVAGLYSCFIYCMLSMLFQECFVFSDFVRELALGLFWILSLLLIQGQSLFS